MNTKGTKFLAVLAVLAMAFAAFAVVDDTDATDTTYINGEIIADQKYSAGNVVVNGDLLVKNGAVLTIDGTAKFIVSPNVTLTIDGDNKDTAVAYSKLVVGGTAKVTIDAKGKLVIGEKGVMEYTASKIVDPKVKLEDQPLFVVNGSLDINRGGQALFQSADDGNTILFAAGSTFNVTSSGSYISQIAGFIAMESGSSASIVAGIPSFFVINAYEQQKMLDGKVDDIMLSQMSIIGPSNVTNSSISKFTVAVTDNSYSAWTEIGTEMTKMKIVEEIITANMEVKGGETVVVSTETDSTTYRDAKTDGELIDAAGAVILAGENKFFNGALIIGPGETYLSADATLSFKYTDDYKPVFGTCTGAVMHVAGSVDLYAENVVDPVSAPAAYYTVDNMGKLCIDGGMVVITKKADAKIDFTTDKAPAMGGIKGAWFFNEDKDVLTICELDAAFEMAEVAEIDTISVSGFPNGGEEYEITSDLTVWNGLKLQFCNGIIIAEDVTLTVAKEGEVAIGDAALGATTALVDIKGAIYDNTCSIKKMEANFIYNVIITDKDNTYEIYMSFANAMKMAQAGDEIEIVKDATVDSSVVIPAEVKVILKENKAILITKDGKITNNGIFDVSKGILGLGKNETDEKVTIEKSADYDKYLVNNNVIIIDLTKLKVNEDTPAVYPSGFFAKGDIFDDGMQNYFLSVEAAEKYSEKLDYLEAEGVIVADKLTLVAGEDKTLVLRVQKTSDVSIKEVVLDENCEFFVEKQENDSEGFTGAVTYMTTAGKSTALFDQQHSVATKVESVEEDDDVTIKTFVIEKTGDDLVLKNFKVVSGEIKLISSAKFDGAMTIESGAIFTIADGVVLENMSSTVNEKTYDITVNGVLNFEGSKAPASIVKASIIINGELKVYNNATQGAAIAGSILSVLGSVYVSDIEDKEAKFTLDTTKMFIGIDVLDYAKKAKDNLKDNLNGVATVYGEVNLVGESLVYNYSSDLAAASILGADGKDAKNTVFAINGMPFVTIYSAVDNTPITGAKVPVYVEGYTFDNKWYTDAELTKSVSSTDYIGTEKVYGEVKSLKAWVKFSTGVGITLYVDEVKASGSDAYAIGTYAVKAMVDVGCKGDVVLTFNGQQITDSFYISPELAEQYQKVAGGEDQPYLLLTAMGEVSPDQPTGMSITEILLIVLVVLIAIMAVIVALRLNRS